MMSATEYAASDFIPGLIPPNPPSADDPFLVLIDDAVVLTADGRIPTRDELAAVLPPDAAVRYLGQFRGNGCYYGAAAALTGVGSGFKKLDLRTILREQDAAVFHMCCRALHLLTWRKRHRHCGVCGQPLVDKNDELSRHCLACGAVVYPRISPAAIVAVIRDRSILLARNKQSKLGFYSVLAGFVEPGETLEECVRREVWEETSVAVKNIRYFGSQPWPFPDSLMIGFVADYAGGELQINDQELEVAGWFTADHLPQVPMAPSISRKLIDWFVAASAAPEMGRTPDGLKGG